MGGSVLLRDLIGSGLVFLREISEAASHAADTGGVDDPYDDKFMDDDSAAAVMAAAKMAAAKAAAAAAEDTSSTVLLLLLLVVAFPISLNR